MSAFIHGFRYNVRSLFHFLEMRYYQREWPSRALPAEARLVGEAVVERINKGTALWHQTGFLGDVVALHEGGSPRYYEELPVAYVNEGSAGWLDEYLLITLEYGPDSPDFPFEFKRFTNPADAHKNPQLHPVLRHYRKGEMVGQHHVMEEIEGRWRDDYFTKPLFSFLESCMHVGAGQEMHG